MYCTIPNTNIFRTCHGKKVPASAFASSVDRMTEIQHESDERRQLVPTSIIISPGITIVAHHPCDHFVSI